MSDMTDTVSDLLPPRFAAVDGADRHDPPSSRFPVTALPLPQPARPHRDDLNSNTVVPARVAMIPAASAPPQPEGDAVSHTGGHCGPGVGMAVWFRFPDGREAAAVGTLCGAKTRTALDIMGKAHALLE